MRRHWFLVLALMLAGTGSWAATDPAGNSPVATPKTPQVGCDENPNCFVFSPGNNSHVYRFADGSSLRVEFVGGVITTFSLTVTEVTLTDDQLAARLDPKVFPEGTTCFHYGGGCKEYAFTGSADGPNGVPVRNRDYKGAVRLELSYISLDTPRDPGFGHAPGESVIFSEDALAQYVCSGGGPTRCGQVPSEVTTLVQPRRFTEDDTMCSDDVIPSLSSVIALNKPLEETDTYCWVSPQDEQIFRVGDKVLVAFRLFAFGTCPTGNGRPLRSRDARVSLAKQLVSGEFVFQDIRIKHFHFDHKEGVNRTRIDTETLTPGRYFITVRSDEFSSQTRRFVLAP